MADSNAGSGYSQSLWRSTTTRLKNARRTFSGVATGMSKVSP